MYRSVSFSIGHVVLYSSGFTKSRGSSTMELRKRFWFATFGSATAFQVLSYTAQRSRKHKKSSTPTDSSSNFRGEGQPPLHPSLSSEARCDG